MEILPLSILPWNDGNGKPITNPHAKDEDNCRIDAYLPLGIVLVHKSGRRVLLGNENAGDWTKGCNCCAIPWVEDYTNYVGWIDTRSLLEEALRAS